MTTAAINGVCSEFTSSKRAQIGTTADIPGVSGNHKSMDLWYTSENQRTVQEG